MNKVLIKYWKFWVEELTGWNFRRSPKLKRPAIILKSSYNGHLSSLKMYFSFVSFSHLLAVHLLANNHVCQIRSYYLPFLLIAAGKKPAIKQLFLTKQRTLDHLRPGFLRAKAFFSDNFQITISSMCLSLSRVYVYTQDGPPLFFNMVNWRNIRHVHILKVLIILSHVQL